VEYCRFDVNNEIPEDFDPSKIKSVVPREEYSTGTLNGINLGRDVASTGPGHELIDFPLEFKGEVIMIGAINTPD